MVQDDEYHAPMADRNENSRIIAEFMGWKSGRRCDGKMLTQAGTSWDFVCKECGTRIHRSRWLPAEARIGELPHDIPMPDYYAKGADWQAVRDRFVKHSGRYVISTTNCRFGRLVYEGFVEKNNIWTKDGSEQTAVLDAIAAALKEQKK